MTTLKEAAALALEAYDAHEPLAVVMEALRTAVSRDALNELAEIDREIGLYPQQASYNPALNAGWGSEQRTEPEQEPVAYVHRQGNYWEVSERFLCDDEKARGWTEEPLYTHPPQRKPLTNEEIEAIRQVDDCGEDAPEFMRIFRIAERAHGIGGEA